MKNKFFFILFTCLGFLASVGFPVFALASQVTLLKADCGVSLSDRLGLTLSGFVAVLFIIFINVWKFAVSFIGARLKAHRTPLVFFTVGYLVTLAVARLFSALEVIFLFGIIGSLLAVVFYKFADRFIGGGK